MSTNQTQYYALSQWEPSDKVERTDFNSDNAKIDAALRGLEARVALLDRAMPNLAYYVGQLAMADLITRKQTSSQKAMLCEAFLSPGMLTLTGGAAVRDGVLCLDGAGRTGTMTTLDLALGRSDWTQARMWVHVQGGTVVPTLNGAELPRFRASYDKTVTGIYCLEHEFLLDTQGKSSVQVGLNLTCGSGGAMQVYDYCLLLF